VCKTRLVYRIERREDGQGPYPTFHNGQGGCKTARLDYVFGAHSLDALEPWLRDLRGYEWHEDEFERRFVVRVYRVPIKHVYDKPRRNTSCQHRDPLPSWITPTDGPQERYRWGMLTHFELMFNRDKSQCLATLPLPAAA
jgi:hypothetical protein